MSSKGAKKYCSVYGCLNNDFTNPDLSFFAIPTEPEIRSQWLRLMNREDLFNKSKHDIVCEVHFKAEDISRNSKRKRLQRNCLPSLHLPKTKEDKGTQVEEMSVITATQIVLPSCSFVCQTETDDFSQNDSKVNVCPQKTCLRCKRSIQHTTAEDQTKKLIAKVYHYFECEFEELRNQFGDFDLTPWSKFRQRTALATGVSETEILQILKEEETQNAEKEQEKTLIRARKRSMYTESSTMEEESSDNNLSDEEQPTPEQGVQNEFETLVVKFEPECDREQVETNTEFVEVKVEPSDADEETYIDMPALKEDPIIKRKGRKTPRKEVTSQQQNTQGELWPSGTPSTARLDKDVLSTQYEPSTSGTSSSVLLTQDQHGSGLLGVDEVKEEKIDIDEEGIS